LKQFDKAIETLSICARLDPADPERQYFIATFYQDKIYRDKSLGPAQRATYIREGIAAADRALAIKPDYMEVFVFKGILLKARAELTTDPAEKSRTMSEAEAQLNRGRELRAKRATTPDPPSSSAPAPSSTTGHPPTFAPPPPLPPPPSGPSSAVRVGGGIKPPVRTKTVPPVYPAEAAASRTQGVVIIEATIDAGGRVADAKVVRSLPTLDQAALDAVRQWEFEPTYVKGQAVPVIMTVTVNFALE
jgi:TonB family protein